jgi:hypothetical protein
MEAFEKAGMQLMSGLLGPFLGIGIIGKFLSLSGARREEEFIIGAEGLAAKEIPSPRVSAGKTTRAMQKGRVNAANT